MRLKSGVYSLLCLCIGVVPYTLWRQDALFLTPLRQWLPKTDPLPPHPAARMLLYNFPDAMWYLGLLLLMRFAPYKALRWCAVAMPFIHEGMQGVGLLDGTFDVFDIVTYLITLILFTIWEKKLAISSMPAL